MGIDARTQNVTATTLDSLKSKQKGYMYPISTGVRLYVAPSGVKSIFVRYRVNGVSKEIRVGIYGKGNGQISLAEAKLRALEIQANAKKKIDLIESEHDARMALLAEKAKRETENLTLNNLFETWINEIKPRKDGNAELKRTFAKDIIPSLGAKKLSLITDQDIRKCLSVVTNRGSNRMAVQLRNSLIQMFNWAEQRKPWRPLLIDGNPAKLVDIQAVVPKSYDLSNIRKRVLADDELRELKGIFENAEQNYLTAPKKYTVDKPINTKLAIATWVCLSTLCRIGALLKAEWQHVDLKNGTWLIPAENDKGLKGKEQDQTVFLSGFALEQFKKLHEITGQSKYCFPARNKEGHVCTKSMSKQICDRQEQFSNKKMPLKNRVSNNILVLSNGKNGNWTIHDTRRTGATLMQALGVHPDVIDRCQSHIINENKVRRHYLHYDYSAEKREAWDKLGKYLATLLSSDNVYTLRDVA